MINNFFERMIRVKWWRKGCEKIQIILILHFVFKKFFDFSFRNIIYIQDDSLIF